MYYFAPISLICSGTQLELFKHMADGRELPVRYVRLYEGPPLGWAGRGGVRK